MGKTINVPEKTHRALKILSVAMNIEIKDIVTMSIESLVNNLTLPVAPYFLQAVKELLNII